MTIVTLILDEGLKAAQQTRVLKKLKALPGAGDIGLIQPDGKSSLSKRMFYIVVDDEDADNVVKVADKTSGVASVAVETPRKLV
jgi:hypothetical protein